MKIAFESFTTALVSYWDSDVIQKAPKDERFPLGVAAIAAPSLVSGFVRKHSDMILEMELLDESNMVDIDKLESMGTQLMDKYGPFSVQIRNPLKLFTDKPLVLSFGRDDVLGLCQKCRNLG